MAKAFPIAAMVRPARLKDRRLPPMTGFLISGGFSLMLWGGAILFFFT